MSHEVPWSKLILETFVEEAMLTKEEEWVLRTRIAGWPRSKQAQELNMSLSTIDRTIKRLKEKYDRVEKANPLLPPRRESKEEEWMDTH